MERKSVLLVEDTEADAQLAVRALRKGKVADDIQVVTDGVEALDFLFGSGPYAGREMRDLPSLILLDLKLPKIDGFEVLRRVRAGQRTRWLPVVILTSSNEQEDIVQSYELGANAYVCKPVDYVQFTEAMIHLGQFWLNLNLAPLM